MEKAKINDFATVSLKSLGASKATVNQVHELKSLNTNNENLLKATMKFVSEMSCFVVKFETDIMIIMEYLAQKIDEKDDLRSIIWTKYFNLALKLNNTLAKADSSDEQKFKDIQNKLLDNYIRNKTTTDWVVLKKIKQFEKLYDFKTTSEDSKKILNGFVDQILLSFDYLIWQEGTKLPYLLDYAKKVLSKIMTLVNTEHEEELISSIVHGRFEKGKLFDRTLIFGEDGGLYALLNSFNDEDLEHMKAILGEEYLKDKIIKDGQKNKIIIGKGSFGTVKFAVSLFVTKLTVPGQVVCIKKTRSLEGMIDQINREKKEVTSPEIEALNRVIDSTVGDYFSSNEEIIDLIYSPQVLDVSLNLTEQIPTAHRKGYLIMEMVPQNTGTTVLMTNPTGVKLDWAADQKPYVKQVFEQTLALLEKKIAFTDLKPDNTLYDIDNKKTYLIDLGGSLAIKEDIEKCSKKYEFQATPRYTCPEFYDSSTKTINLKKALSYSCGKILKDIVEANKDENPDFDALIQISQKMTLEDIAQRISIEQGIEEIVKIGNDKIKLSILFERYILKLKNCFKINKSSIGINDDILETKEQLIPPKIVLNDPDKMQGELALDLETKMNEFSVQKDDETMLILGKAGSGKSVMLQLKFMDLVETWDSSKPLPLYFNLSRGVNLKENVNMLDLELKINLTDYLFDKKAEKNLILFIDSFDEGLYKDEEENANLIKNYLQALRSDVSSNIKIIISCRTDYMARFENYDSWFSSQKYEKYFITPLTYKGKNNVSQKDATMNELVLKYLKTINAQDKHSEYMKIVNEPSISAEINTGLVFQMIMKVISYQKDHQQGISIGSKIDIYRKFISVFIEKNLKKNYPTTQEQKLCMIRQNIKEEFFNDMQFFLHELAINIASLLHMKIKFRLTEDDEIFKLLEFDNHLKTEFKNQRIYYILRNLPLKIDITTGKDKKQKIAIEFIHDTIKNYYLLEAIKQEARNAPNSVSKILGAKMFSDDTELIRFLRDGLLESPESKVLLTNYLSMQIELSKYNKNVENVCASSNSMTILVAARHDFSGTDLNNSIIREAILRNGLFSKCSFKNTDLSHSNFTNIKLSGAIFEKANLSNTELSISPFLHCYQRNTFKVQFSNDGKLIMAYSSQVIKVWDAKTYEEVWRVFGDSFAQYATFSPDSKYLAGAFGNNNGFIWRTSDFEQLYLLNPLKDIRYPEVGMHYITFSPDSKFVAGSFPLEGLAKVWDLSDGKELYQLPGHSNHDMKIVYSPSGEILATYCTQIFIVWEASSGKLLKKFSASCVPVLKFSHDGTLLATRNYSNYQYQVIIWDVKSDFSKSVLLKGHTSVIHSFTFSKDGTKIVTCSDDSTARIWDTASGIELNQLKHVGQTKYAKFSPDETLLAIINTNRIVIWDKSGNEIQSFTEDGNINKLAFSPCGKYLAFTLNNGIKLWQTSFQKQLQIKRGHNDINIQTMLCDPAGKCIFTASNKETIKIWDIASGNEMNAYQGSFQSFIVSVDGKFLIILTGSLIIFWDIYSGKQLDFQIKLSAGNFNSVSSSPDGRYLAIAAINIFQKPEIWDISSNKRIDCNISNDDKTYYLEFSKNGAFLIRIASEGKTTLIDTSSWKPTKNINYDYCSPCYYTFSNDVKTFICAGFPMGQGQSIPVEIWSTETQRQVKKIFTIKHPSQLIITNNDKYLICHSKSQNTMAIFETSNWTEVSLTHPTEDILFVSNFEYSQAYSTLLKSGLLNIYEYPGGRWLFSFVVVNETAFLARNAEFTNCNISKFNQSIFVEQGAKVNSPLEEIPITKYKNSALNNLIQITLQDLTKLVSFGLIKKSLLEAIIIEKEINTEVETKAFHEYVTKIKMLESQGQKSISIQETNVHTNKAQITDSNIQSNQSTHTSQEHSTSSSLPPSQSSGNNQNRIETYQQQNQNQEIKPNDYSKNQEVLQTEFEIEIENNFKNGHNALLVPIKKAHYYANKKKIVMEIRAFYLSLSGEFAAFVSDTSGRFLILGNISSNGALEYYKIDAQRTKSEKGVAEFGIKNKAKNNFAIFGTLNGEKLVIYFDFDFFQGYYVQGGTKYPMIAHFKFISEKAIGVSRDGIGVAIWSGTSLNGKITLNKFYIKQHSVSYTGKLTSNGSNLELIGQWSVSGYSGDFYFIQDNTQHQSKQQQSKSQNTQQTTQTHSDNQNNQQKKISNPCKSSELGFQIFEDMAYYCYTCAILICESCLECHSGHQAQQYQRGQFYCHCLFEYSNCQKGIKCTRSYTGKNYYPQINWNCNTCNMANGTLMCTYCCKNCHKGHDVKVSENGVLQAFCDCPDVCQNCSGLNKN